jgi:hypothetical protein
LHGLLCSPLSLSMVQMATASTYLEHLPVPSVRFAPIKLPH